jgi:type IV secretory pathway protease TraF
VQVRVTDTLGVALASVRVAWSALDGGIVAGSALTDSAGTATARWTLGRRAGGQRLLLHVGDPRLIPATTVRATAEARAPHVLLLRAGDKQSATAGKALAKPIVVQVLDSLGNPVEGASLRTVAAAGTAHDTVVTTDATGRATMRWTLGSKTGAQRLDVRLSGTKARLAVSATARAPVATPVRSEQRRVDKPRARK